MCGIAGWISAQPLAEAEATRLSARLLSEIMTRGPDGEGAAVLDGGRVGLVHTRLAIIDPQARSAQPMVDAATGAAIVFNGEIYNYVELRAELAARGVRFATDGDTEVLLRGYLAEGCAFFSRLRGMYAFVLWDSAERAALALRDPLGIKPLYVGLAAGRALFGSSPAAARGEDAGLAPAAAVSLAVMGAVIEPLSPFAGVEQLRPGELVRLAIDGGALAVSRRRIEPAVPWSGGGRDGGLERLEAILSRSVEAHFTADVPVAVFQSAGLDSTLISALAMKTGRRPMLLTIGFEAFRGTPMDEVPGAAAIAAQLGLPHRSHYVTRAEFEAVGQAFLDDMRTPTADAFNTYLIAWFCRQQGFKVALSGLGADELFAGYPSFRQLPRLALLGRAARLPAARRLMRLGFEAAWRSDTRRSPKLRFMADYLARSSRRYLLRRAYFAPEELSGLLAPAVVEAGLAPFLGAFDDLGGSADVDTQAGVRALELDVYMRNVLLRDADWAGMAHGVEIRTPFVDIEVLRGACDRALQCAYGKDDLRALAHRVAPALRLPHRPKTGFMVPHDVWSAQGGGKNWDPMHFGSTGPRAWNRRVLQHWFQDWALR